MAKTTIRNAAAAYEPKTTKSIADLESVPVDASIETVTRGKPGQEFELNIIKHEGEEYKVPDSVLKQLKVLVAEKKEMTHFKVIKSGEGLDTSYQVIPLD